MHAVLLDTIISEVLLVWYACSHSTVNSGSFKQDIPGIMATARNVVRRALLYGMGFISDLHIEECSVAASAWILTKNA